MLLNGKDSDIAPPTSSEPVCCGDTGLWLLRVPNLLRQKELRRLKKVCETVWSESIGTLEFRRMLMMIKERSLRVYLR